MQKAAIAVALILVGSILAIPLLPTPAEESAASGGEAGGAPAEATTATAAAIPSEHEAPPLWNEQNIVGTAWEVSLASMPEIDDPDSTLLVQYSFVRPGRIELSFSDEELDEEEDDIGATFFKGLLPDTEGTYRIEGAQIQVTARMVTGESTDIIEIRGDRLYYHGAEMTPVHEQGGGPRAGQAPGQAPHAPPQQGY